MEITWLWGFWLFLLYFLNLTWFTSAVIATWKGTFSIRANRKKLHGLKPKIKFKKKKKKKSILTNIYSVTSTRFS